ncbi:MAG: hypothetical protein GSR84_04555 [Desulfurococcales archaeon]|nr:hypothetical protein [Desulfurococcales archaeon]
MARSNPLLLLLLFIIILSSTVVELWYYRDAPGYVKIAILAGAGAMLLAAVLGLPLIARRRV